MNFDSCSAVLNLTLALNATASIDAKLAGFLKSLNEFIPFDSAAVLMKNKGNLNVLASMGLKAEARVKKYPIAENPRFKMIIKSANPIVFPPDSTLADPFDHLLEITDFDSQGQVHSCLGCPLTVHNEVIGCLSLDALKPGVFNDLSHEFLKVIGALVGTTLRNALIIQQMERDNHRAMEWAREIHKLQEKRSLIGDSVPMQKLRQEIKLVARSPFPVLVLGETGTGKEIVAKSIHQQSSRYAEPWITVNCAALPENLAESELFGHLRGAFTGADNHRPGKFELAHQGTIFLDEIGDLSLNLQAKTLRLLQEGEIQRVGADETLKVDVRVIAATHRNLEAMVKSGEFRQDLYHRLHVFPIRIAPLRERLDDLELLAANFVAETARNLGLKDVKIDPELIDLWKTENWPGNVRELQNRVRATIIAMGLNTSDTMLTAHLNSENAPTNSSPTTPKIDLQQGYSNLIESFRAKIIAEALRQTEGSNSKAADLIGMDRGNFSRLRQRLLD
ncbi:MAG: nitric oxide reductase transcriptional regulator NorR [Fibrobacter sp.]|nr:nitric oxide reductase transcriptional regulator NorR [Fibrobacter sp.]